MCPVPRSAGRWNAPHLRYRAEREQRACKARDAGQYRSSVHSVQAGRLRFGDCTNNRRNSRTWMHEPTQCRGGFESRAGPSGPGVRLLLHPPWCVNLVGRGFAC
jgi:hypothetical protein